MGHTTIRVSDATRDVLRSLAAAERKPMQAIVVAALEAYRRERFLGAVNRGYAALREDPVAWAGVTEEREAWEGVLLDGLSTEPSASGAAAPKARRPRRSRRK